ncbi:hypothetical protein ACWGJX_31325 [Streptomyces sp. NPDC054775]
MPGSGAERTRLGNRGCNIDPARAIQLLRALLVLTNIEINR